MGITLLMVSTRRCMWAPCAPRLRGLSWFMMAYTAGHQSLRSTRMEEWNVQDWSLGSRRSSRGCILVHLTIAWSNMCGSSVQAKECLVEQGVASCTWTTSTAVTPCNISCWLTTRKGNVVGLSPIQRDVTTANVDHTKVARPDAGQPRRKPDVNSVSRPVSLQDGRQGDVDGSRVMISGTAKRTSCSAAGPPTLRTQ
ncbi:hypothetical protein CCHR01_14429 [Colletotrichum chrysophilum]|uniref:Uncharacterized protein n=1 Tax=Colletotrichum chrysophilum TaxID=1836956 RepID=A0AAD9EBY8_9PEZI|nr:hypothetical protein K456DRAFT_1766753 [Colletotrichum gloeosporioides 23]KAK1842955.1 hypothetical protein CCHR01_14429 [Colletotrichum chrysophilum]